MLRKKFSHRYKVVFNSCIKALKELDIAIDSSDYKNYTITGTSSTSLFSWGEVIQINFEVLNQNSTEVEVESVSSAQLFSWGKNEANEKKIMNLITQIIKER